MINYFAWTERKFRIAIDARLPRGRTKPDNSPISKEQRRGTSIGAEALASAAGLGKLEPRTKHLTASAMKPWTSSSTEQAPLKLTSLHGTTLTVTCAEGSV